MAQTDQFGEELEDFVRRVAELKAARSVPSGDLQTVLDAALFELDHVADQLWPWYERLTSGGTSNGPSTDRQEQQLLRAIFQRLPLPVALMDRETVVRRLNHAAAQFTGIRPGYATGRALTGFLAHADRAAFRSQVAAVARGEGDRSLTVHLQQRPSISVRATLTAVRTSGEPRTSVLVVLQPADARMPSGDGAQSPLPDLAETTRHQAQLDLVDAMSTALLTEPATTRAAVLERAARVLHGRFADWVITDEGAARLCRMTVLGPTDRPGTQIEDLQAQDPAGSPARRRGGTRRFHGPSGTPRGPRRLRQGRLGRPRPDQRERHIAPVRPPDRERHRTGRPHPVPLRRKTRLLHGRGPDPGYDVPSHSPGAKELGPPLGPGRASLAKPVAVPRP